MRKYRKERVPEYLLKVLQEKGQILEDDSPCDNNEEVVRESPKEQDVDTTEIENENSDKDLESTLVADVVETEVVVEDTEDNSAIDDMSNSELRKEASRLGLSSKGKKVELTKRIKENLSN